jgi:methionine-rich copper-binding protein CopC
MRRTLYEHAGRTNRLAIILLGLSLILASATTASARGVELVFSEPAAGEVLAQAPAEVRLWFSEELADGSSVHILDASGKQVNRSAGEICPDDPNRALLVVALAPLATGTYQAHWRRLGDSEAGEGDLTFSVGQLGALTGQRVAYRW